MFRDTYVLALALAGNLHLLLSGPAAVRMTTVVIMILLDKALTVAGCLKQRDKQTGTTPLDFHLDFSSNCIVLT